MKLELTNSLGYSEEFPLKSQTIRISGFFNYLQLTLGEELLDEVKINDRIFYCNCGSDNKYVIPCYMSRENSSTIQFNINGKTIRFVLKYDEEMYAGDKLIDSFADFHRTMKDWIGNEKKAINDLVQAIQDGEIHLLQIINPLSGLDDESILEDINRVLPFALDICMKPRQHLRIDEEILAVELVKRINPSSLQHLASHSEHWRARTITGLIPSRLRAEVYEDDINIYENIFFKMVVDAILKYVVKKHDEVKIAISQKATLLDWEYYASEVNDYKRIEMLQNLLPEYDSGNEDVVRTQFKKLKDKLEMIEKQISSIISTPFFQSLDPIERLELPIQPTNIINMDNRYNELFKIWNKLWNSDKKTQEDISGASISNIDEYYKVYVQVMTIYALYLQGYTFQKDSCISLTSSDCFNINLKLINENYVITANGNKCGLQDVLTFKIEESLNYTIKMPASFPVSLVGLEDEEIFKEIWEDDNQILLFRKKPTTILEKKLSQVIKKYGDSRKNLSNSDSIELKKLDLEWRKQLSEQVAKMPENRFFDLNLHMLFSRIGSSEKDLLKYTTSILESAEHNKNCAHIYVLPIELHDFSKVENINVLKRLINFGEAYGIEDAPKYGDYRVGIFPVSQTDLRSIQRLSKLFNLFVNHQLIKWGTPLTSCPSCQSNNIIKVDEHSWQCRESDCQLIWGVTRCSTGCNEFYEWMKPNLEVKINQKTDTQLDKILLTEMIFDRLVITDFEYKNDNDNKFHYYPRCPKCGHSSLNYHSN